MLTSSLINPGIPRLDLSDSVSKSRQLILDYRLTHLPVVSEGKYMGLVSDEDLLDSRDLGMPIENLIESFIPESVAENIHFLSAVGVFGQYDTNLVPVVNDDNDYLGVITAGTLLKALGNFTGAGEAGGIIVMEMERADFSISEISRIVEENECTILHLNVTPEPESGLLSVTIQLNRDEIGSVISTLERYDYNVVYYLGREHREQEISSNYKHLMNYLNL